MCSKVKFFLPCALPCIYLCLFKSAGLLDTQTTEIFSKHISVGTFEKEHHHHVVCHSSQPTSSLLVADFTAAALFIFTQSILLSKHFLLVCSESQLDLISANLLSVWSPTQIAV